MQGKISAHYSGPYFGRFFQSLKVFPGSYNYGRYFLARHSTFPFYEIWHIFILKSRTVAFTEKKLSTFSVKHNIVCDLAIPVFQYDKPFSSYGQKRTLKLVLPALDTAICIRKNTYFIIACRNITYLPMYNCFLFKNVDLRQYAF